MAVIVKSMASRINHWSAWMSARALSCLSFSLDSKPALRLDRFDPFFLSGSIPVVLEKGLSRACFRIPIDKGGSRTLNAKKSMRDRKQLGWRRNK